MVYTTDCFLENFPAWEGGKDTLDVLREREDCDAVEDLICEVFGDKTPSETQINDFLWFERDFIAEHLGYEDWQEYEEGREDEEEDEDEDEDEE